MKILISFLLLVLAGIEGYSSESKKVLVDEYSIENIQGLILKIQLLINYIDNNGSGNKIETNIIKTLENRLSSNKITGIQKCLRKQAENIQKLAQEFKSGSNNCIVRAQNKLKDIKDEASEIKEKSSNIVKLAAKIGADCQKNFFTAFECFNQTFKNLQTEKAEVERRNKEVTDNAQRMFDELQTCDDKIQHNLDANVNQTYKNIFQCASFPELPNLYRIAFIAPTSGNDLMTNAKIFFENGKVITEKITDVMKQFQTIKYETKLQSNETVSDIVKTIMQHYEDELGPLVGKVKECVDQQNEVIKKIAVDLVIGVNVCTTNVSGRVAEIDKEILAINNTSDQLVKYGLSTGNKCLENASTILECLNGVLNNLTTETNQFINQINSTLEKENVLLNDVRGCITIIDEAQKKKADALLEEIRKCTKGDPNPESETWKVIKLFISDSETRLENFKNDMTKIFQ